MQTPLNTFKRKFSFLFFLQRFSLYFSHFSFLFFYYYLLSLVLLFGLCIRTGEKNNFKLRDFMFSFVKLYDFVFIWFFFSFFLFFLLFSFFWTKFSCIPTKKKKKEIKYEEKQQFFFLFLFCSCFLFVDNFWYSYHVKRKLSKVCNWKQILWHIHRYTYIHTYT